MMSTNPSSAYFAWKHYHPSEAEDMAAGWGAAWRAGGRAALNDSSRLVELVPLLRDMLYLLADGQIEADLRASDRRPTPLFDNDHDELAAEVAW
jgi:hypothetical protein